jgi:hypothetical protein
VSDRVVASPPVIREEIARWLPDETAVAVGDREALAYLVGQYGRLLELHRQVAMDTPADRELHSRAVSAADEAVAPIRERLLTAPPRYLDLVHVAEFLSWCDTTGEHHGQPWAAMVDTLREREQ